MEGTRPILAEVQALVTPTVLVMLNGQQQVWTLIVLV